MSFIRNQEIEMFLTWIEYNEVPMLISGSDGDILWCNKAFEDFSGYSNWEIVNKITWEKMSINDENLEADREMIKQCISGEKRNYSIKKQFSPKNDKPIWTDVHVCRFPTMGEFKFFLVTILPFKNGSAAALTMTIEAMNSFCTKIESYKKEVTAMEDKIVTRVAEVSKPQNETEQIFLSFGRLAFKYPKIAAMIGLTMLIMILGNQAFEVIKNLKDFMGF